MALLQPTVAAFAGLILPRVVSGHYPFVEQPVERSPRSNLAWRSQTVSVCPGKSPDTL
jgi:hypothetical protein